jgi:amidophosphoribosyltransferase
LRNAQPVVGELQGGRLAVVHNGQLTNHADLRLRLGGQGAVFHTDTDTEVLLHLCAAESARSLPDRVAGALGRVRGAYSLLFLDGRSLVAVRDPYGIRPLCVGTAATERERGRLGAVGSADAIVVASEPCVFELLGGRFMRDLEPGEMLVVDRDGMRSVDLGRAACSHACLFEYVYFARPDSVLDGVDVYELRRECGTFLADEHPVGPGGGRDTVVVPVPDTGLPAALGLASRAGLPVEMGLGRNYYVGRTFIEPHAGARDRGVRRKLSVIPSAVAGKRVIVVDDSIVRGTTSRQLVSMLRAAGAAEVHLRIASPPIAWPCYYGFDTSRRGELLAASHAVDALPVLLGADSVGFLSLERLLSAVSDVRAATAAGARLNPLAPLAGARARSADGAGLCHACFSGDYPVPIELDVAPGTRRTCGIGSA